MAFTLPVPEIENLPDLQINGSMLIEVNFAGTMQKGLDGDMTANMPVEVNFGATLDYIEVSADFGITVLMSAEMIYSDTYTTVTVDADLPDPIIEVELYRGAVGELNILDLTISGSGRSAQIASGQELELDLTLSGSARAGYVTGKGSLGLDLQISGSAHSGVIGKGNLSLNLKLYGRGVVGASGVGSLTLGDLSISGGSAYQGARGTGSLELDLKLSGIALLNSYECLVLNTKNFALTEYDLSLKGLFFFNGKYFGANATSLYEFTGDTDDGSAISWYFKTGKLDLQKDVVRRLRHVWLSYRPAGDLILTVGDGNDEYEYRVEATDVIDGTVRVKVGKGIRAKYIYIKLQNKEAETVFIDRIRLFAEQVAKKR